MKTLPDHYAALLDAALLGLNDSREVLDVDLLVSEHRVRIVLGCQKFGVDEPNRLRRFCSAFAAAGGVVGTTQRTGERRVSLRSPVLCVA